ncbi:hypothetical protein AC1031_014306 [Aphanomyces cochlioides]|nr:hypothetical protein AC1031_014306 [Aphanomyces cochlioides]
MATEVPNLTTTTKRTLGVLIFDELAIMDAFGPLQYFHFFSNEIEVVLVAKTTGLKWTLPNEAGVPLHAPYDFETCPQLDILHLPGGRGGDKLFSDPAHQEFILRQAKTAEYLLSVCTGSGFLAACGLLDGKRATNSPFTPSRQAAASSTTLSGFHTLAGSSMATLGRRPVSRLAWT